MPQYTINSKVLDFQSIVYISPDGDDVNDGSEGSPVRTLVKAISLSTLDNSAIVFKRGRYTEVNQQPIGLGYYSYFYHAQPGARKISFIGQCGEAIINLSCFSQSMMVVYENVDVYQCHLQIKSSFEGVANEHMICGTLSGNVNAKINFYNCFIEETESAPLSLGFDRYSQDRINYYNCVFKIPEVATMLGGPINKVENSLTTFSLDSAKVSVKNKINNLQRAITEDDILEGNATDLNGSIGLFYGEYAWRKTPPLPGKPTYIINDEKLEFDSIIYMSPTGNDNNDGSKISPVKTLEKAQTLSSGTKKAIVFLEGEYNYFNRVAIGSGWYTYLPTGYSYIGQGWRTIIRLDFSDNASVVHSGSNIYNCWFKIKTNEIKPGEKHIANTWNLAKPINLYNCCFEDIGKGTLAMCYENAGLNVNFRNCLIRSKNAYASTGTIRLVENTLTNFTLPTSITTKLNNLQRQIDNGDILGGDKDDLKLNGIGLYNGPYYWEATIYDPSSLQYKINDEIFTFSSIIHISPKGNDNNDGTDVSPVYSMQKAMQLIEGDNPAIVFSEGVFLHLLPTPYTNGFGSSFLPGGPTYIGQGGKTELILDWKKKTTRDCHVATDSLTAYKIYFRISLASATDANYTNAIIGGNNRNIKFYNCCFENFSEFKISLVYDNALNNASYFYNCTLKSGGNYINSYSGKVNTVKDTLIDWEYPSEIINKENMIIRTVTPQDIREISPIGSDLEINKVGVYFGNYAWTESTEVLSYMINDTKFYFDSIVYISPDGDDNNQGTKNLPVYSLQKAHSLSYGIAKAIVFLEGEYKHLISEAVTGGYTRFFHNGYTYIGQGKKTVIYTVFTTYSWIAHNKVDIYKIWFKITPNGTDHPGYNCLSGDYGGTDVKPETNFYNCYFENITDFPLYYCFRYQYADYLKLHNCVVNSKQMKQGYSSVLLIENSLLSVDPTVASNFKELKNNIIRPVSDNDIVFGNSSDLIPDKGLYFGPFSWGDLVFKPLFFKETEPDTAYGFIADNFQQISTNWSSLSEVDKENYFMSVDNIFTISDLAVQDAIGNDNFKIQIFDFNQTMLNFKINAIPTNKTIIPTGIFNIPELDGILEFKIIGNVGTSEILFALTKDNLTYDVFVNGKWEVITESDFETKAMTRDQLLLIDLNKYIGTDSGFGIAYYVNQKSASSNIFIDSTGLLVRLNGTWKNAIKNRDMKYGYPNTGKLRIKFINTGTYKINYLER